MTDHNAKALEDLDLLEEIGWFPNEAEGRVENCFKRIRAALAAAEQPVQAVMVRR